MKACSAICLVFVAVGLADASAQTGTGASPLESIKHAVEELFGVRVEAVRTQTRKGKKTRFRNRLGQQPNWKKAIVTLNEEDRIEFF